MWFCQHSTEEEALMESSIPRIVARLDPEGETCLSIDGSVSLLNIVVSRNDRLMTTN
jgi:hypothetical protein